MTPIHLLVSITTIISITQGFPTPNYYNLEQLPLNPGIYFEKLETIRLKRMDWRIIIAIDIASIFEEHETLNNFQATEARCKARMETPKCNLALDPDRIKIKINQINQKHEEIKGLISTMGSQVNNEAQNLATIRTRRTAPLAIVGGISKSLFGTATSDDIDLINQNIDKLFKDQSTLVKSIEESTHYISTGMKELYNITRVHDTIIKSLEQQVQKGITIIQKEQEETTYTLQLMAYTRRLDDKLNNIIIAADNLITIIKKLREKKLHPKLLSQEIVEEIHKDINQLPGDLDFPIPPQHLRPEELIEISTTDAVYDNGRIIALLHLPLIDNAKYIAYKTHPLKIPQDQTGTAYIQPTHKFIAISNNLQNFIKIKESTWNTCTSAHYGKICSINGPIQNILLENECEINMLVNPSPTSFQNCDIRINANLDTQWTYLQKDSSWLFSAPNTESLRIICPGIEDKKLNLKGIGIIKIAGGCTGKTKTATLMHEQRRKSNQQHLYIPDIHLNITEIYPILKHINNYTQTPIHSSQTMTWDTKGKSIEQIITKIHEVGQHHRDTAQTNSILYTSIGGNFLIIILSTISYIIWRKCKQTKTTKIINNTSDHLPQVTARRSNLRRSCTSLKEQKTEFRDYTLPKQQHTETPQNLKLPMQVAVIDT